MVADYKDAPWRCLLRFRCAERQTARAQILAVFSEVEPVIAHHAAADELAFITPEMAERELDGKIASLSGMELVSRLRVASL